LVTQIVVYRPNSLIEDLNLGQGAMWSSPTWRQALPGVDRHGPTLARHPTASSSSGA